MILHEEVEYSVEMQVRIAIYHLLGECATQERLALEEFDLINRLSTRIPSVIDTVATV